MRFARADLVDLQLSGCWQARGLGVRLGAADSKLPVVIGPPAIDIARGIRRAGMRAAHRDLPLPKEVIHKAVAIIILAVTDFGAAGALTPVGGNAPVDIDEALLTGINAAMLGAGRAHIGERRTVRGGSAFALS